MHRLVRTWPYLLGTLGLCGVFWLLEYANETCGGAYPSPPYCPTNNVEILPMYSLLTMFVVMPALSFLGGVVLGLFRGVDWVTILACLVLATLMPFPFFDDAGRPDLGSSAFDIGEMLGSALMMWPIHGVTVTVGAAIGAAIKSSLSVEPVPVIWSPPLRTPRDDRSDGMLR
jgi:hypothetical protein